MSKFRNRITKACELAQENLKPAQSKIIGQYDEEAVERSFNVGEKVLVLLPVTGHLFKLVTMVLMKLSERSAS